MIRWHGSHGLHASYAYALFSYFYEGKKKNHAETPPSNIGFSVVSVLSSSLGLKVMWKSCLCGNVIDDCIMIVVVQLLQLTKILCHTRYLIPSSSQHLQHIPCSCTKNGSLEVLPTHSETCSPFSWKTTIKQKYNSSSLPWHEQKLVHSILL